VGVFWWLVECSDMEIKKGKDGGRAKKSFYFELLGEKCKIIFVIYFVFELLG